MRKTSKIVSLLLTLVMVLGITVPMTVSAETLSFKDVPTTHNYYEAIMNLVAEGIVNGMGDGTYQPEGAVTRAQFAKIICYATDVGDVTYSEAEKAIFTDVAPGHWAANNIKTAYDLKIINGMGDGTFAPENNVLYEQAVKMAVCALGYTQLEADREGGYPTGYIYLASKAGLLKGIKDGKQGQPLNRGAVARLIDNMRNANQRVDGEETGSMREESSTTAKKIEGRVIGIKGISLYAGEDASACSKYEIEIENGSKRTLIDISDMELDIDKFLGRNVIAYYDQNKGDDFLTLKNITYQSNKNDSVKIYFDLIKGYGSDYINYYESNKSEASEKIYFDTDAIVMVNGQATEESLKDVLDKNIGKTGTITLVFSNGGKYADVAFLKSYETVIVDSVDPVNYKVYAKPNETNNSKSSYTLDKTDRNKNVTIKNASNDIDFTSSTIRSGNILLISESEDGKTIEALVSSRGVSGTVVFNDGSSIKFDSSDATYYISRDLLKPENLDVGSYVSAGLDAFGRIARVTASQKGSYVYAYLSRIEEPIERDAQYFIEIYKPGKTNKTLEGEVYPLAKRVKIDSDSSYDSIEKPHNVTAYLRKAAQSIYGEDCEEISQPVRVIINKSNEVEYIITNLEKESTYRLGLKNMVENGLECTISKSKLGEYKISSSTSIIVIDKEKEEYLSKNSNYFKEKNKYFVQLAGITSTKTVNAIYVYGSEENVSNEWAFAEEAKPMIIMNKSYVNGSVGEVVNLTLSEVTTGGELIVLGGGEYTDEDTLEAIGVGDVIRVAYEEDDEENLISDLQVLAFAKEVAAGDVSVDFVVADGYEEGANELLAPFRTVIGVVEAKDGSGFVVAPGTKVTSSGELDESFDYVSSAKIHVVTIEGDDVTITSGTFDQIVDNKQPDNISRVLIYAEKGSLKSIVVFR